MVEIKYEITEEQIALIIKQIWEVEVKLDDLRKQVRELRWKQILD